MIPGISSATKSTSFTLHKRKRYNESSVSTSLKLQKTTATTITPLKNIDSSTQRTPKNMKQAASQRTPVKHTVQSTGVQVKSSASSKHVQAVPPKSNKASNTTSYEVQEKGTQINSPPMDIKLCKHSDNDIKMYTGLNSYALFRIIFEYVNSPCNEENCAIELHNSNPDKQFPGMDAENQFFLVLYKMWQNPMDKKLAEEFGTSDAKASHLFHCWNERMYRKFKLLNISPSLNDLQQHMTQQVKEKWPKLREIYDGTEFKSQKPPDPFTQRQLWSSYKHDHTVKVQIGCSSTGIITSISDTYGGSVSDKELFSKSQVLEHLNTDEAIMVDKGFLIHDLLQDTGVELIRPPFLASKSQFSTEEREQCRDIARSRIVVENVNSRFKHFKILSQRINVKYLTCVNEIVYNCCSLSNFGPPMRKSYK